MDNELMVKEDLGALGFNEPLPEVVGLEGRDGVGKKKEEEVDKESTGFVAGKHMKNKRVWW